MSAGYICARCGAAGHQTEQCPEAPHADGSCSTCDGIGLLVDQTYEGAELPDDGGRWRFIQRCDECERFAGDDDAADYWAMVMRRVWGAESVAVAYCFATATDDNGDEFIDYPGTRAPGDFAVGVYR